MSEAFIVEAVRAPIGKKNGSLAAEHPIDVAAHVLRALIGRSGIDPAVVDDVILGATDTIGPQVGDIARLAWLATGFDERVPGVTIDRQCGSSQQAVHFAAQAVMSGSQDVVVAGGVQMMSVVPLNMAWSVGDQLLHKDPFSTSKFWTARYGDQPIDQFHAAEMIAEKWGIERDAMEEFALRSHQRATAAIDGGLFSPQIEPYGSFSVDETPRRDTSLERMAKLKTLMDGGRITAGLSSQISDGAAALLVCSAAAVERYGLEPLARVHAMTVVGDDPVMMLTAPIPATQKLLDRAGLEADDVDLYEINEAFASVVLAWQKELFVDTEKINVNGGAIALGHPIGASGARIMTDLVHELRRTGKRFGLQSMCEGGGQANAILLERI